MSVRELRDRIRRRARKAGVELTHPLAEALEKYYVLLAKWNEKINLTSLRLPAHAEDDAIDRLLIEPVVAARHVAPDAQTMLDIGSGGGSPALPLRLAAPGLRLSMVESKTRKAVFLREAVRELGLDRVTVETSRFEELLSRPELHEGVDLVTVRAGRSGAAHTGHPAGVSPSWGSALPVPRARRRTRQLADAATQLAGDLPVN